MTHKEALVKSLVWRFLIAIPVGFMVTYLMVDHLFQSLVLTVVTNFIGTVLYYLFDVLWFEYLGDAFGFDKVSEEDSAGSRPD